MGCHFLLPGIFLIQESNPVSSIAGRFFTNWATRNSQWDNKSHQSVVSRSPSDRFWATFLVTPSQHGNPELHKQAWCCPVTGGCRAAKGKERKGEGLGWAQRKELGKEHIASICLSALFDGPWAESGQTVIRAPLWGGQVRGIAHSWWKVNVLAALGEQPHSDSDLHRFGFRVHYTTFGPWVWPIS